MAPELRSPWATRRSRRAAVVASIVAGTCLASFAAPASADARIALLLAPAQSSAQEVADALRRDPVYVDPAAERAISDGDARNLAERIREAGAPIFVAVLPESMAASAEAATRLTSELEAATGLAGTYAVIVGDRFRATSTQVPEAGAIATAAFQAGSGAGAAAVLERFVDDIAAATEARLGGSATGSQGSEESQSSNESSGSALPLLLLMGGGAGLLVWARSRRSRVRRETDAELAADIQMLRAELSVLADDVLRLEPQVAVTTAARDDYEAGVQRFRAASAALDYADEPIDLIRVQRVVDEAQYAMSRARAIVEGREPPPPPAELRRPGRHDEPPLDLDERGVPVYVGGGPIYGGGWFGGGGGGLFSGLLLGSMLGGWGWGGGFGHDVNVYNDYGDGGGGLGGGDFGGDFGGGDFGGDVGGGDW